MIETKKQVISRAFGLTISSEFSLPELYQIDHAENPVDITVTKASLTQLWSESAIPNKYFVVKKDMVLFRVPDVAIYLIENGQKITVDPVDGAHEDQVRLFILGTSMGAILLQRRILPLHGSAVAIDGKAYAIVGDSGAGKSTLASAFLQRGYQLLSDDVIPVTLSGDNTPVVTPAYPQQKLWLESLQQFGMESGRLRPIFEREKKFAVPLTDQFAGNPLPLAGVCELFKTDEDSVAIVPVQKMERFHTLFRHTYRNFMIGRAGLMEWHFQMSAKMMKQIEIYQLHRPANRFTAHELADLILKTTKGEKII
jgi:hypothetical protein